MTAPPDSLAQAQQAFAELLFTPDAPDGDACARLLRGDGIAPDTRIGIYRNNLRANFHNVLALEFPVLQQLCGEDYFRQLATEYQDQHPSTRGNLHHIGEQLAPFLAARFADTPYNWFADIAALEWAWQECHVAAEPAGQADLAALAALPAEAQAALHFSLHPASRVLRSRWPVRSIWAAHQQAEELGTDVGAALEALDMHAAEDSLLLRSAETGVEVHALSAAEAVLLATLAADASLVEALDQAVAIDPQFDVGAALQRAASLGLFSSWVVRP